MNSLENRLAREAEAVARSVDPTRGAWLVSMAHATRSRRRARAAGAIASAAVIVVASAAAVTLFLGRDQEPVADVSPSPTMASLDSDDATASPSASAPAPEAAMVDGFAPVPQFAASDIPWSEVGPGWFVVVYRSPNTQDLSTLEYEQSVAIPQLTGGISLLSPDGDWYAATTVEALGAGQPMDWDGTNLWMARTVELGPDVAFYGADLLGLADGMVAGSLQGAPLESLNTIGPGVALGYAWSGDGLWNPAIGIATQGTGGCYEAGSGYWGWNYDDMGFLYSPADGGKVVCFGPGADSAQTSVTLVNVGDVAQSRVVNQFKFNIYRYSFVGWVDSQHFLFARINDSTKAAEALFSYNLADNSLEELPFNPYAAVSPGAVQGFYDSVSQRHVIFSTRNYAWELELSALDGTSAGDASGDCPGDLAPAKFRVSGGTMLVQCRASGIVSLVDLTDGKKIGEWELGGDMAIDVFDHPDS